MAPLMSNGSVSARNRTNEKVVASLRAKVADYREQLAKNKNLLDNLS